MKGELFAFAALFAAVGAGIAFLDWIARNIDDALDEVVGDVVELPDAARRSRGRAQSRSAGLAQGMDRTHVDGDL